MRKCQFHVKENKVKDLYQRRFRTSAVALALATLVACGESKTTEQYLQDALAHQQQGETSTAVIELKNALKNDPKNPEPRLMLGNIYLDQGKLLGAEKELSRAKKFGAAPSDVQVPLARVLIQLGKYNETIEMLATTSELDSSQQIVAAVLKGQALLALGRQEEAEAELNMANEINAGDSYSQFGQAMLASSQEDFEKSKELIEGVLAQSPDMLEALSMYGNLSFANGDYQAAIDSFSRYLELRPTAGHISLLLANSLLENKQYDEAEAIVQQLLSINPNHAYANLIGAKVALRKEQYTPALDYAERSLVTVSNNFPAKLIAGISAYRLGRIEQSYQHLSVIKDALPADHYGRKVLAVLKLKLGYAQDASNDFNDLKDLKTEDAELLVAASLQFAQSGNTDSAAQMMEKAVALQPDNAKLKVQEGLLKLAMDDDSGLGILENAVGEMSDSKEAELYLALNYLKSGKPDKAHAIATKWQKAQPEQVEGWLMAGLIDARMNAHAKARQSFEHVLTLSPQHIGAKMNLSMIAERQGDMDKALSYVKDMLKDRPDNELALVRQANLLGKQSGDYQVVIKTLEAAQKQLPESLALKIRLAKSYGTVGQPAKGIALLESIDRKQSQPATFWQTYGDLFIGSRQYPEALALFQQWAGHAPNLPETVLRQLAVYELMGKPSDALRLIDSVSDRFKQLPALRLMQASFLMLNSNLADSRTLLMELKAQKLPSQENYLMGLEGELLYREGKRQESVTVLETAYAKTKKPRLVKILATAYLELDQGNKATEALLKHLELYPVDTSARVMLASIYINTDPLQSIEQYKILLNQYPNNPIFLNNLAWQLMESGNAQEAQEHAVKAVEQQPENPFILDTYGVILQQLKQQDKALEIFNKAQELAPTNAAIALHLAQALLDQGSAGKVQRILAQVENPTPEERKEMSRLSKLANNS